VELADHGAAPAFVRKHPTRFEGGVISIVVDMCARGSRDLVRTLDAAARQTVPVELLLAASTESRVIPSLEARLGVNVHRAPSRVAAINAAIAGANSDVILVVSAPWQVQAGVAAGCGWLLAQEPGTDVVVPGLNVQTPDGLVRHTASCAIDLPTVLANPVATPPVFAICRALWDTLGAFDERFGELAASEWWLRVLAAPCAIATMTDACAVLEASEDSWWPPMTENVELKSFRAVLEAHRSALEPHMSDSVVRLEIAAADLLRAHRAQLVRRDRQLAELEELRAKIAHHRAFIGHHGNTSLDWGEFRRTDPISRDWGYDRGVPIDRRYIEDFLASRSSDIRGAVLEVQEDDFTRRFGGPRVTHSDVVDLDDGNQRATIVADLRAATGLADGQFDCIILTQTLHVIDDAAAVLRECRRLLKPDGVLLATLPATSRVCLEYGEAGDQWRVTSAGARTLFEAAFGTGNVDVTTYGNVLTNVAFLLGLACSEVADGEFDAVDPYHPLVIGVRAQNRTSSTVRSRRSNGTAVVLLYHRVDERPDVHDLSVTAELFEEQLSSLARECRVMPLDELLASAGRGPERAVAITFDDGYVDTLEKALPILERLGLPATVFATTRWLESPGEYWWDILERALIRDDTPPTLTVELDGAPSTFATHTREGRRATHDRVHERLVHARLEERDRVIARIAEWSSITNDPRRRPVVADELRRLASSSLVSIGAHTVNHVALPDQDPGTQRTEIVDSVRGLARVVDRPVDLFAYPYGAVDRATAALARETCRWSAACETAAIVTSFDAAAFPRLEVKRWDSGSLLRRMSACAGWH
jgi:peptidoglycan/xylan/chitin deacetylase (PgdA/CDA1 family)